MIKVACGKCHSTFAVRDDFAGKSIKCPKCTAVMNVPSAGTRTMAGAKADAGTGTRAPLGATTPGLASAPRFNPLLDLLDEAGVQAKSKGPSCPNCAAELSPNAIICVQCGFNLATGEKLSTAVLLTEDDDEANRAGMSDAEKLMSKAEKDIDEMPVSSFGQDFGEGNESFLIAFVAIVALVVFIGLGIVLILTMDQITELIKPEVISLTASIVLAIGCITYITVIAFLLSPAHGIGCVASAGLYCIIFAFSQGKGMIVPAIVLIVSLLIGLVSWLFIMYGGAQPDFSMLPMDISRLAPALRV